MSRAASLPGAVFFPEIDCIYKKPLVLGSFAAWGSFFSRKATFFEAATCPGQRRCLGQSFFQKIIFLKKPFVPGSFAVWGRTFPEIDILFEEAACLGQLRCLGQILFQTIFFLKKPRVPGSFAAKSLFFLYKPLVLGSLAASGRTVSQKSDFFFE